ncbi:MAG: glycosyltransferase family 2 protein [Eubacteriales bacterium]|nr:glycosyltransferase family 2 protein [Eubacteriales bacterium]
MVDFIVPALNEAGNIAPCYEAIDAICKEHGIEYQIIFIDDGSKDGTWQAIEQLPVKGIQFSRNFGKEAAIACGLAHSKGDAAIVIDCDLQHPVEMIPKMVELWQKEGYAVVNFVKQEEERKGFFHKLSANLFNKMMGTAMHGNMIGASDFKLLDKRVVQLLVAMPERQKFFRGLVSFSGFSQCNVYYNVKQRQVGHSKWNFVSLFRYALVNIASFSSVPLQLITILGLLFLALAIPLIITTFFDFFTGRALRGFTTVILLQLITGSAIMIGVGVIGFYISMMYNEIKQRPMYICQNKKDIE